MKEGIAKVSRREIRIKVMQAIYAYLVSNSPADEIFTSILEELFLRLYLPSSKEYNLEDARFLKELFYGTIQQYDSFSQILQNKLENWDLERVAYVDRAVIMMGMFEMLHFQEIPIKVSLNEYTDIAKLYSTEKSNKFVNGVLDAIHHQFLKENRIIKVGRGLLEFSR
ncbi:MAG: transcription antitermination factor NusB [Bacteroidia bacterium]|nr:transcription antitermination factor NusB [Bacteroidia bacterium]MDW8158220.1 transcription antitermination factor NusB [Bacteroidia bacterium]